MKPRNSKASIIAGALVLICGAYSLRAETSGITMDTSHVVRTSFGLDLDMSCDSIKGTHCTPSHLHLGREDFHDATTASGKAYAGGVHASVDLKDGGRIGVLNLKIDDKAENCHFTGQLSPLHEQGWKLTRDHSVFVTEIDTFSPVVCGGVSVRLHTSALPSDLRP